MYPTCVLPEYEISLSVPVGNFNLPVLLMQLSLNFVLLRTLLFYKSYERSHNDYRFRKLRVTCNVYIIIKVQFDL